MGIIILVNVLIVITLVISIFQDTYGQYSKQKAGLFYCGMISNMPLYKNDMHYGALVSSVPILDVVTFFFLPVFMCAKDKNSLVKLNRFCNYISYGFISGFVTLFFIAGSLAIMPLAYFYSLVHKILILK